MRRVDTAAALGLAALLVLAGCSDDVGNPNPTPTDAPDQGVSVTGTFRVQGGPTPGIDEPLGGTVTFDGPASEEVDAPNGTFTVALPPGTYTVTGHPAGNFAAADCPSATVVVADEQASPVEVTCIVE